jgi:hypothetical protein
MSPQEYGISTTYKTRVALEKPCKECLGIVIGQLKDSRVWKLLSLRPASLCSRLRIITILGHTPKIGLLARNNFRIARHPLVEIVQADAASAVGRG